MTNKELLYIEDALGHEQYFQSKCCEVEQQLSNAQLKNTVCELKSKHQQIFNGFYHLLNH